APPPVLQGTPPVLPIQRSSQYGAICGAVSREARLLVGATEVACVPGLSSPFELTEKLVYRAPANQNSNPAGTTLEATSSRSGPSSSVVPLDMSASAAPLANVNG